MLTYFLSYDEVKTAQRILNNVKFACKYVICEHLGDQLDMQGKVLTGLEDSKYSSCTCTSNTWRVKTNDVALYFKELFA